MSHISVFEFLFGPLAGPECRRLIGRTWLFIVRVLAALPAIGTVLVVGWIWWVTQLFDPDARPYGLFTGGLVAMEGLAITIAFLLGPAMLAGSLAGEKRQGTLEMLLVARVSSAEILLARLMSRLVQVGFIMLAGLPLLIWSAAICRFPLEGHLVLVALPAAVAFGGGGMALAASAVSRHARDALLSVYLVQLLLLFGPPLLGAFWPAPGLSWLLPLNPYRSIGYLAWGGTTSPAWLSIGWWTALGLGSTCWAAWRFRSSYLRRIGGTPSRRAKRRWRVPPLGNRPMLWKELYIDRTSTLGRVGRVLGWLIVISVLGGSTAFAAVITWQRWSNPAYPGLADAGASLFAAIVEYTSTPLLWLVQWTIGLRAAVAIASEREQATWDSLLTCPLEGREIVPAKIAGSLYALRGILLAVPVAWTVAVACGAMSLQQYWMYLSSLVVMGVFMAAVGVWFSLVSTTTTRAMTLTLVVWVAAGALVSFAAMILVLVAMLILLMVWMGACAYGLADWNTGPPTIMSFETAWHLACHGLYLVIALLVALHGRYYFDRLAGRIPTDPARQALVAAHRPGVDNPFASSPAAAEDQ